MEIRTTCNTTHAQHRKLVKKMEPKSRTLDNYLFVVKIIIYIIIMIIIIKILIININNMIIIFIMIYYDYNRKYPWEATPFQVLDQIKNLVF